MSRCRSASHAIASAKAGALRDRAETNGRHGRRDALIFEIGRIPNSTCPFSAIRNPHSTTGWQQA
jgi:hypothetical protein